MAKNYANDPMDFYDDTQKKRWQIIYLYQTMTAKEVGAVTGYASSTVRTYYNKYRAELPTAIAFFEKGNAEISERRKTIQHNEHRLFFGDTEINWLNGAQDKDDDNTEKAYLFRFYEEDPTPVFSKIGTTAKTCLGRLKDEIRYYNKKANFNIKKVEICEIWDCGDLPAESYESYMRALLIRQYPNTWKKNDRFFGVTIPVEVFINLCSQYAEM